VPQGNADHCPDFPCHRPLPCRVGDVSSEKIHGGGQKGLPSVRRRCLSLQRPRHCRATSLVSPRPCLLARFVHRSMSVLTLTDIFHLGHRATGGHRATAPRAVTAPGAVGSMPPRPFWPSELSGPPTHERRSPWAECEAQHRGAVLIIF
jgi:hypothetical protein